MLVMPLATRSLYHAMGSERIARFDLGRALDIFKDVAQLVQRLHHAGLVHSDLKPRNVLFDAENKLLTEPDTSLTTFVDDTAKKRANYQSQRWVDSWGAAAMGISVHDSGHMEATFLKAAEHMGEGMEKRRQQIEVNGGIDAARRPSSSGAAGPSTAPSGSTQRP